MAAIAAVGIAAFDDAAPTGQPFVDGVWRVGAALLTVISATLAGPVAGVIAAAAAAGASGDVVLFLVAVVGIAAAVVASRALPLRRRELGAVTGLAVSVVVFRLSFTAPHGMATLVAGAVVAVLVLGAVIDGERWYRRTVVATVLTIGFAMVLGLLALGLAGLGARSDVTAAIDDADAAQQLIHDGELGRAGVRVQDAAAALQRTDEAISKPWVRVTKLLPVLAQHVELLDTLVGLGAEATETAGAVLTRLDDGALAINDGSVDIATLAAVTPDVEQLASVVHELALRVDELDSPWLVSPVRSRLRTVRDDLADLDEEATRASAAIGFAPAMLGADGPRRYLVVFATPSEARGSVGLLGNWAVLTVTDGRLALGGVGRISDLAALLAAEPDVALGGPARYLDAYGGYDIVGEPQDATISPHFPDVGEVVAGLFASATGTTVNGVVLADPATLAGILQLTGPIVVDDVRLDARTAERFLLVDQYETFASNDQRIDFLSGVIQQAFLAVLSMDSSDLWTLRNALREPVRQDRLAIYAMVDSEQTVLAELGLTAGFPAPGLEPALDAEHGPVDDVVAAITLNRGQNKIDAFLHRWVSYDALVDPATGGLRARMVVELTNDAPAAGLSEAIIGSNDQGLPPGTNWQRLRLYSAHRFVAATIDGGPLAMQVGEEFGLAVATADVQIPAGATVTIVVELEGEVDLRDGYDLAVAGQALPNPDRVDITVWTTDGSAVSEAGMAATGSQWFSSTTTSADLRHHLAIG